MKNFFKKLKIILLDSILTGVALVIFALFHHVIPRDVASENVVIDYSNNSCECSKDETKKIFSEELISNDESYISENIKVNVQKYEKLYNNKNVIYYLADIYINNIESFQTAFAKDKFGRGYNDWMQNIADNNNAIVAINGDYYGLTSKGIVIRNGVLYRSVKTKADVAVLYHNGELKTYKANEFNANEAIESGAWQAWSFGPSLLDSEGKALEKYNSSVTPKNPRTGLGYYEPGHYVFVVVEGRSKTSAGLTMNEFGKLFEELGCKVAYNFDGGQSSTFYFNKKIINNFPDSEGQRTLSDIILIKEV